MSNGVYQCEQCGAIGCDDGESCKCHEVVHNEPIIPTNNVKTAPVIPTDNVNDEPVAREERVPMVRHNDEWDMLYEKLKAENEALRLDRDKFKFAYENCEATLVKFITENSQLKEKLEIARKAMKHDCYCCHELENLSTCDLCEALEKMK
jgi:hypothetical protein